MNEVWRDVIGYEGLYQVSNTGKVKRNDRILATIIDRWGYHIVRLSKSGRKKYMVIHRVVAKAFISNPTSLPEINHIDEDKSNNHVSNLEWCTRSYNALYSGCIEKMAQVRRRPVGQFDNQGNLIKKYSSLREATNSMGCSLGLIGRACRSHSKCYGYKWEYIEGGNK